MRRPLLLTAVLPLLATIPAARAADRHVDIVNKTGMTMIAFHASAVGAKSWEEDILGQDTVDNGGTVRINIDDGTDACKFDFKAVFEGGTAVEKASVDVCKTSTFTYNR